MSVLRGEVVYLYAFDVGSEILTSKVESELAKRAAPFQIRRRQLAPPEVSLYRPLVVHPTAPAGVIGNRPLAAEIHVYDIGVITVSLRLRVEATSIGELHALHPGRVMSPDLDAIARGLCEGVRAELREAVRGPAHDIAPESYTVFCMTDLGGETAADDWLAGHRPQIAGLLNDIDAHTLSIDQVAESLRHARSLEHGDAVVVDWDAALVIDLFGQPDPVLYVLELANLQLLEWRALDSILDIHLSRVYDLVGRPSGLWGRPRSSALREMRQLRVDVARLADEVSNITKFVGDWFLARVYLGARERFHLDEWRASVEQRLGQLDRLYGVVQTEVNERRMLWLEVMIVVLILVELLASLWLRQ
ncbi:MAG: hypothetical protein K1X57_16115 [Gemmataceae bacterium]|nr:hypothetical protein [Gemmataceae bacterium]